MNMMLEVGRVVAAAACLAGVGMAQSTWIVPNDADLTSYIQAAAPGDTLMLGSSHPNFTLTKGLNLIGNNTQILPEAATPQTVVAVPAGQRASLSGLVIALGYSPPFQLWSGTLDLSGDITVQNCTATSFTAPVRVRQGHVVLRDCTLQGSRGSTGLIVEGGTCSVVNSILRGSNALQEYQGPSYNAGPGVVILGGNVWLTNVQVKGGNLGTIYGQPSLSGSPGLVVNGNATVQVTQSTLTGGDGAFYITPIYAWPAIQAGSGVVFETGNTLSFGQGPTQGGPAVGNVQSAPSLVGLRSVGSLALGATFTLQATAGPAQMPLCVAASLASSAGMHPLAAQPVLGNGNGLVIQFVAVAPAPGAVVSTATTVPNITALRGVCVSWQAFQWTGSLVQASAIVGGVVL